MNYEAKAGTDVVIETDILYGDSPTLMFYDDVLLLGTYDGKLSSTGTWLFTIPAEDTANKEGLYWYCIYEVENKPCFKQPIYFK